MRILCGPRRQRSRAPDVRLEDNLVRKELGVWIRGYIRGSSFRGDGTKKRVLAEVDASTTSWVPEGVASLLVSKATAKSGRCL